MSERTFIVDQHGQNFMYRTNMPIKDGKFQYDELVEVFKQKADEAGLEFPSEFQLVDISLINKSDYADLNIERNFFKQNPEKGRFRNYIIIGSLLFPNSLGAKFRNWMAYSYEYWNYDQQNDLNKYMHDILIDTTTELPQIIFFHCEAGEDRTGQIFGGYQMEYNGWSYKKALIFNNHVETREIHNPSRNGMNWYCWYLQLVRNYQNLECDYLYDPEDKIEY